MHSASMLSNGFLLSLSLCLDIGLVNVAMLSLTLKHGFKPGRAPTRMRRRELGQ